MITCREATDWLLEAELSELQAPADRAVAEHVATCSGCAARAARIIDDTARLTRAAVSAPFETARHASDVSHPALAGSRRLQPAYIVSALLAASLLVAVLTRVPRTERSDARVPHRTTIASSSAQPTAEPAAERSQPRSSVEETPSPAVHRPTTPPMTSRLASTLAVVPVAVTPQSVPAVPVRAVRLDTLDANQSVAVEARPSLAVDVAPSSGRYAVLGSTPKVTVVWFY